MFEVSMMLYPWDLRAEDAAEALDRWHGELGVSGAAIWMGTPAITELRARPVEPRMYRTRGGLYLPTGCKDIPGARCQPVSASHCAGPPLEWLADQCGQRSLAFRAVVSTSRLGRMAERYPEFACRNAFGLESQQSLCLAHPDVQGCIAGVIDLLIQRFSPSAVVLADVMIASAEALNGCIESAAALGELGRALLGVCFCDACRGVAEGAGVDVGAALNLVRSIVQREAESVEETGMSLAGVLADSVPLAGYLHSQSEHLRKFILTLRGQAKLELVLLESKVPAGLPGSDLRSAFHRVISSCDAAMSPRRPDLEYEVRIPSRLVVEDRGARLVAKMHSFAEQGYAGAALDHYGLIPEWAMESLRQAIRYARRTAKIGGFGDKGANAEEQRVN